MKQVVVSAAGLIRYFANLYGGGCDKDDLFQAGNVALLKALKNYDQNKGATFVTYASHLIIGEIRHMVRKQASFARPGCIIELQTKVNCLVEEYIKIHGIAPSVAFLSQELHIADESVYEVMRAGTVSFDDIDTSKIYSTAYESFNLPIEDKLVLYQAIQKLSDFQKKIIHMLFYRNMTQQEVAKAIGLTQKQVSRAKLQSLQVLKQDIDLESEEEKSKDDPRAKRS